MGDLCRKIAADAKHRNIQVTVTKCSNICKWFQAWENNCACLVTSCHVLRKNITLRSLTPRYFSFRLQILWDENIVPTEYYSSEGIVDRERYVVVVVFIYLL